VEAVLDSRQDQAADVCVVPNQLVLGNATVSTQNVCDESNIKVTNAIDFYSIPRPGVSYHQYLNLFLKFAVKCPENL
jgi:hypothetical protein